MERFLTTTRLFPPSQSLSELDELDDELDELDELDESSATCHVPSDLRRHF